MSNQAKAQEYWNAAKHHLMELARVDNPYSSAGWSRGYFPTSRADAGGGAKSASLMEMFGGMNLQYGEMPSDAQVNEFIRKTGGNPWSDNKQSYGGPMQSAESYAGPGGASSMRGVGTVTDKEKKTLSPSEMLQKLIGDYDAKVEKANAENLKRYDEGKKELTDLRTRNQDRVGNWGRVQEALNAEQAKYNLGAAKASLASRGLGDSTIGDAFAMKNARDLALLQQDVSERRDDRISRYDTSDTGNLAQWIYNRNDIAPDAQQFSALTQQLGQMQALQAAQQVRQEAAAERERQRQSSSGPQIPYYPAPVNPARYTPIYPNGSFFSMPFGYQIAQPQAVVSNRYPETHVYTRPLRKKRPAGRESTPQKVWPQTPSVNGFPVDAAPLYPPPKMWSQGS